MPLSLYDAVVPSYIQTLNAAIGLIEKAKAHCAENNIAEQELLAAKLAEDMLPLSWQLKWVSTHSIGAINGVRKGGFSPDRTPPAESLSAFSDEIKATVAALDAISPEELDDLAGQDVLFSAGELRLPFTGQGFLLSFSLPNFYFHATTAYAILRQNGVPIGKRDYLGAIRLAQPA